MIDVHVQIPWFLLLPFAVYLDMRKSLRDHHIHMAKKKKKKKKMGTDHHPNPCLPQEVVLEHILTRLPFNTLMRFGCICKLWYNSIHNDPHFASSHFLQSQKHPFLIFNILNAKFPHRYITKKMKYRPDKKLYFNYFFWGEDKKEDDDGVNLLKWRNYQSYDAGIKSGLVGYCNGLGCLINYKVSRWPSDIKIFNPTSNELLMMYHPMIYGWTACCGFGFDSLTNEYKVVIILYTEEKEFKCMVFTLGANSWRETTSSLPSPHEILSTTRQPYSISMAIFCGGALFWRSTKEPKNMLLSFDLHDETFQVIQLPADCVSPTTTTTTQRNFVHLLESKGSLCVARLEEVVLGRTNEEHNSSSSSFCKVHLHFLKDYKVKQVWIKETFDILSSHLSPCYYDISAIRVVGFAGRVLLYWFSKKRVKFYDLHMKHLKRVKVVSYKHLIFTKNKKSSEDMDYQLHNYTQNCFTSLKTFLPEEAHRTEFDSLKDKLAKGQAPRGYLNICSRSDPGKSIELFIF